MLVARTNPRSRQRSVNATQKLMYTYTVSTHTFQLNVFDPMNVYWLSIICAQGIINIHTMFTAKALKCCTD